MTSTATLVLLISLGGGILAAQDATFRSLLSKDLADVPGKELSAITVEYHLEDRTRCIPTPRRPWSTCWRARS